MTDCEYCMFGSQVARYCGAENGHYSCTREEGHDGPHVACAPRTATKAAGHELAEWTDEEGV